jgi:hypothetical protein
VELGIELLTHGRHLKTESAQSWESLTFLI